MQLLYFCEPTVFAVFCEAHGPDVGGKGAPQVLLVSPFTAITVLFPAMQIRLWSLWFQCKITSLKGWDRRKDLTDLLRFEEGCFFPSKGKRVFHWYLYSSPLWGGTDFGQVPLGHRILREPKLLHSGGPKFTVRPRPGLSGVSNQYWVLQIGTKRVNMLNSLNLWLSSVFPSF